MIQSKYRDKFTPLLPLVQQQLSTITQKSQLKQLTSNKPITLALIDNNVYNSNLPLCISDFKHSMQANKTKTTNDFVHPQSRLRNNFYFVKDQIWISLNSKIQDLGQPSTHPHPYEPYFHFKSNYDEYRKERLNINYRLECQVINIKKWALRIVNISNTGYYGVIMDILDFKITNQKFMENVGFITSIIYQPQIKEKLEILRVEDLRKVIIEKNKNQKPRDSLFFHFRNINMNPNVKRRVTNIVEADKDQELIGCNFKQKYQLIPFGEMEGANCLQYPLDMKEIDVEKMKSLRMQELKTFFNAVEPKKPKEIKPIQPGQLWSSDDQESSSQQIIIEHYKKKEEPASQYQSSGDEDDPLRNLYLKQFKSMSIV